MQQELKKYSISIKDKNIQNASQLQLFFGENSAQSSFHNSTVNTFIYLFIFNIFILFFTQGIVTFICLFSIIYYYLAIVFIFTA